MGAGEVNRTLSILVRAKDFASGPIGKINKNLSKVGTNWKTVGTSLKQGAATAVANLAKVGLIAATVGVGLGVTAVRAAGDFEAQLNTINTVAHATPAELDRIGDSIRKLARERGTPLEELTTGYYDLVSAEIAVSQAAGVLDASNKLAIGGLASTAETVDLLTTSLNTYGVSKDRQAAEAARHADIFAKAIERGKVTAADIAASFPTVGSIAANSAIEIEEIAAAYAQLTAKGVPATEVATQARSAIVALTRRTGDLEKLEKATGKSYLAIAGKKGLVVALEELRRDAIKQKVPLIDLMGRVEGYNFALATTGENLAGYQSNLEAVGDATGTAASQMDERNKGLNWQMSRLRAIGRDVAITFGQRLLPQVTRLADGVGDFIADNQAGIERFADDFADAFGEAIDWGKRFVAGVDWGTVGETLAGIVGVAGDLVDELAPAAIDAFAAIPWDTVGDVFAVMGEGAKAAIGAFRDAPEWLQTAVITGWGLNKLTGGAFGTIVSELGKGLIKGVLGITAAVVNVNGAKVNGGGGGGGGPTVVPGGKPGSGGTPTPRRPGLVPFAGGIAFLATASEASNPLPSQEGDLTKRRAFELERAIESLRRRNPSELLSDTNPAAGTVGDTIARLEAELVQVRRAIQDVPVLSRTEQAKADKAAATAREEAFRSWREREGRADQVRGIQRPGAGPDPTADPARWWEAARITPGDVSVVAAIDRMKAEQTATYERFRREEMSAGVPPEERAAAVLERFREQERDAEAAIQRRYDELASLTGEASEATRAAARKEHQDGRVNTERIHAALRTVRSAVDALATRPVILQLTTVTSVSYSQRDTSRTVTNQQRREVVL